MSDQFHSFESVQGRSIVALPFKLKEWIGAWGALRGTMARDRPDSFSRDEWGYLIHFLSDESLWAPFRREFGKPIAKTIAANGRFLRPRGIVSLWLPNNVSLLGPLSLILLSLTGNRLRLKAGSQSTDLTIEFLEFCKRHIRQPALRKFLHDQVEVFHLNRDDPRHQELSRDAHLRIVFGSDQAVRDVLALEHPLDSSGIGFSDRQSEVWLEPKAVKDSVLQDLLRVFAVYGQAGCTSPHRVVLLDGTASQLQALVNRLLALWPKIFTRDVPPDMASENVMAAQWAKSEGWKATTGPRNAVVLAWATTVKPRIQGRMLLPIVTAARKNVLAQLPPNIQTVGHALTTASRTEWLQTLAQSSIKRFVPIAQMHHFSSVWDGWAFWRSAFEEVELGLTPR